MSEYWQRRAEANEEYAAKMAGSTSKRLKALHNDAYKRLKTQVALLADKAKTEELSRSELWRSKEYIDLMNSIRKECGILAEEESEKITETLETVFDDVIGRTMKDFGKTPSAGSSVKEQLLNSVWSGENYSSRIHHNTDALAEKLKEHITNYIMTGQDARQALQDDMSMSYYQADRLVRTETAYMQTQASIDAYRQANITEVEWIAEPDCCDDCAQYSGKTFPIDHVPLLPIHPNCRCCIAPVIK